MPPKPNELDKANFTSLFFAFRGTKSNPDAEALGLIKFRVGGTISLTIDVGNIYFYLTISLSIFITHTFLRKGVVNYVII